MRLEPTPIDAVTRQDGAAFHSALANKPYTADRTLAVSPDSAFKCRLRKSD